MSNPPSMKEYQSVIVRLGGRSRDDEEAITDLLNERARGGWELDRIARLDSGKLLMVFARPAP